MSGEPTSKVVFERYVAIGDSSTEGLDDPNGRGGYRGWANRLAEHLAEHLATSTGGTLLYANLAVRGRRTRRILDEQLAPALAMRPDLVSVFSGTNDVVARRFDLEQVASDMHTLQTQLVAAGARVITFTLPDLTPVLPLARSIAPRVARLNQALRSVAADSGATLVDFAAHPAASDPRLWSEDRLHANSAGHRRIAAALAEALALPGFDDSWAAALEPPTTRSIPRRLRAEARWVGRYLVPWIWRHAQGRSSGDGRRPKRAELEPFPPTPRPAPTVTGSPGAPR